LVKDRVAVRVNESQATAGAGSVQGYPMDDIVIIEGSDQVSVLTLN
jgi:hypothetical protein